MNPLHELSDALARQDKTSGVGEIKSVTASSYVVLLNGVRRVIPRNGSNYSVGNKVRVSSGAIIGLLTNRASHRVFSV